MKTDNLGILQHVLPIAHCMEVISNKVLLRNFVHFWLLHAVDDSGKRIFQQQKIHEIFLPLIRERNIADSEVCSTVTFANLETVLEFSVNCIDVD